MPKDYVSPAGASRRLSREEAARARDALNIVPGGAAVNAFTRFADRITRPRASTQPPLSQQERIRIRNARLNADTRLRGRNGDMR